MAIEVIILTPTVRDILTKTPSPNLRNLLLNFWPDKCIVDIKQDRLLLLPLVGYKNLNVSQYCLQH